MMRAVTFFVAGALAAGVCFAAAPAGADDLTPAARRAIEEAFFDARYADVLTRVSGRGTDPAGLDRFPLDVLERAWRLRATGDPSAASLLPALKTPPEAADRWPLVTALLAEREHRETVGVARLSEASPLVQQAQEFVAWQVALYRPVRPEDDPDPKVAAPAKALRDEALDLRSRALLFAALAVVVLLGVAALEVWAWRPAWARRWDGEAPSPPPPNSKEAQDRALNALDRFLALLRQELAPGDIQAGWNEALQQEWVPWIERVRSSAALGEIPDASLERALCDTLVEPLTDSARTPLSAAGYEALDAIDDWRDSN